jgi:hypothetical protein
LSTQYEVFVDQNERRGHQDVVLQPRTEYGQLCRLFVVKLPVCAALGLGEPSSLIMAAVRTCKLTARLGDLDIHFYADESQSHVLDIMCLQCVVGRIPYNSILGTQRSRWAIIDRSGNMARAEFLPN